MNNKIRITKEFSLETGHALYGYDGLCKNVHGHSYKLYVTIIGKPIDESKNVKLGMVIDFSDLKESLHNNNNDTVNPTLDIRALVEGPTSKGGTCNTRKKKNAQVEDGKKQEMIELYRWKRKSNGGKEFVQISIPADLLKSVPNS